MLLRVLDYDYVAQLEPAPAASSVCSLISDAILRPDRSLATRSCDCPPRLRAFTSRADIHTISRNSLPSSPGKGRQM